MKAVRMLLSEELEKNHYVLNNLFQSLDLIRKEVTCDSEYAPCELYVARNGEHNIRCYKKEDRSLFSGNTIPPFHTEKYDTLIERVAELNARVFKQLQLCHSAIQQLSHYRDLLIDYLCNEIEAFPGKQSTGDFLANLALQKDDYLEILNAAYVSLGNDDLKSVRLF